MPIVKIMPNFQVVIPKDVREKLNLRVGDLLRVEIEDDKIVLIPMVRRKGDPVKELLSLIREPLDIDAVRLIEKSWNED
ncbi:MAG: AbrB family transcriptional regulator [Thermoprotei archaeon]|nr:MAG: AbrB family transcriptional regulator [Thermoprotei archaeon]HDD64044.1 AbrB/MazE/SpoVT family DNA-binding domain-containing protein [Thermoprotei archaeon]